MRGAFEREGDIRSIDLLSALVALWREKSGGALRFSRSGATAGFDVVDGEVVATLSSQAHFDTAAILMRAGKLDPAAIDRLTLPAGSDPALAAMQAGLLTGREWRWGQKIRAIEVLSDLLGWLEGDYAFEPGPPSPAKDWTLPIPRLVLELFLRTRDRTLVEHCLGPSDLPLLRSHDFDEEFETFGLTSDAGSVVRLIDGKASAEEIAERSSAEEFAVLKLLAALTTLGLVHPAEGAPSPPPRSDAPAPRKPKREAGQPREQEKEPERAEAPPPADREAEEEARTDAPVETASERPSESEPAPMPIEKRIDSEPEGRREEQALPSPPPPEPPPPPRPAAAPARASDGSRLRLESAAEAFDRALGLAGGDPPPPPPPKRRSGAVLAGLLAVLVIAVAGLLIVRSRGVTREQPVVSNLPATPPESPVFPPVETAVPLPSHGKGAGRPSPTPGVAGTPTGTAEPLTQAPIRIAPTTSPTLVPTRPAPTKAPTLTPTRPAPTTTPTLVPTRLAPTQPPTPLPTPVPTRVPVPTAAPTAVSAVRGERTRAEWIRRAERDRKAISKARNARYAVQLELACELPTLEKAWGWDKPSGTMWLLTTSYRGRTCFRVLWGRYGTLAEASAAKTRVPGIFTAPPNRPTVVSVR